MVLGYHFGRLFTKTHPVTLLSNPLFNVAQGCQMGFFQTKNPNWVNFGGSFNGKCWYILWTLGPFYGLLLYFIDI
jgi:hypothetical protein